MDRKCVVIERGTGEVQAFFEKGFCPEGSAVAVEHPLEEARSYALGLAEGDPNGTYEIYLLDSEVIRRCEILEHPRRGEPCQTAIRTEMVNNAAQRGDGIHGSR